MQVVKRCFAWLWSKKWWVLLVVVGLAGVGYWLYGKYLKPVEDMSFVSTDYMVMRGEVSNSLSMVGTTQFANAQKLTFVNKGRVTSVKVKVGDQVKKGQVLAMITTDDLDKDVEKARKNLKNQQLNLKKKLDSSNRELDLLESQSNYEVLLLKQKTLPQEQKLALEEEERKIKDQEKLLQEAQEDYALLLSGRAGVTNADLALSKTVRARNEKFEQLVRDFRNQANTLQGQLQAYDEVFKMTDLYNDGKPNVYIGAKNQTLLTRSNIMFWDLKEYVDALNDLYKEYSVIPLGQLTEDYVLSGYTVFKSLGTDMQEWGKVNYEMILESVDHIDLTKVQIVALAKRLGTDYEDH
ncbi:MAG: efflux RND transporter periplasmic adaptor subunit [bacterium]|nr:efflux RND transporter periplasmic adaptor subunit [bacterium]